MSLFSSRAIQQLPVFICEVCGWTTELEDQRISQLLAEDATTKLDFQLKRSVVEFTVPLRAWQNPS